jgi:hypothetical protein
MYSKLRSGSIKAYAIHNSYLKPLINQRHTAFHLFKMSQSTATKIPPTPIIVHHLNNSRSQRILWLLEELELNYEIKKYQRGSDMLAPPELKEVHPLGKSPVITDGPHTLAESGAIIEYLINR